MNFNGCNRTGGEPVAKLRWVRNYSRCALIRPTNMIQRYMFDLCVSIAEQYFLRNILNLTQTVNIRDERLIKVMSGKIVVSLQFSGKDTKNISIGLLAHYSPIETLSFAWYITIAIGKKVAYKPNMKAPIWDKNKAFSNIWINANNGNTKNQTIVRDQTNEC